MAVKLSLLRPEDNRRGAHEGCSPVLAGAAQVLLMVAILSMPGVDSMPLMSPRLLPALLHSACRMPCLTSCRAPALPPILQTPVEAVLHAQKKSQVLANAIPSNEEYCVSEPLSHRKSLNHSHERCQTRSSSVRASGLCSCHALRAVADL